ncbi:MAG TPA: hypothetical protein VLL95_11860, partial [Phnomibacter sp.]|nr:hypothetical protein [Phnomibacter sp.]
EAFPAMKEHLGKNQVELLMPSDYLNDETKKKLYKEVQFEMSGMFKFVESMQKKIRGSEKGDVKGAANDLQYISASNADPKVWRAVGKFAGDMGLDAVLVIETSLYYDGKTLSLDKIVASIIGPNTVPFDENDKKYYAPFGPLKGYLEGINYGWTETFAPDGPIWLAD